MMTSLANKPDRCGPRIPAKLFHPKWVGVYFQGLSKQRLILLQRESSLKSWRFFPNPSFPLLFEVLLAFAEKEENPQLHLSRWLCVCCAAMSSHSHNSFKGTFQSNSFGFKWPVVNFHTFWNPTTRGAPNKQTKNLARRSI